MSIFTDLPEDQEIAIRDHTERTMVYLFEAHHCMLFEKKKIPAPWVNFQDMSILTDVLDLAEA